MTRKIAQKPASETTDRRLKLYSLAAAAAGVSVLALAQPSEGEVVVTKKAIQIHAGVPVTVDLNKDGLAISNSPSPSITALVFTSTTQSWP